MNIIRPHMQEMPGIVKQFLLSGMEVGWSVGRRLFNALPKVIAIFTESQYSNISGYLKIR